MITRFRLSALTAARLDERAISAREVLRRASLPSDLLQQDKIILTTDQLFAFWRAVGDTSRTPAIGLALGSDDRIEGFDIASLAALSAPTLNEALERLARYKRIVSPEEIQISRGADESAVTFRWLLAKTDAPPALIDMYFAWIAMLARRGTAGAVNPLRVEFARERRDEGVYESHFGCAVAFNAPADAIVFRTRDLPQRFSAQQANLFDGLAPERDGAPAGHERDVRHRVRAALQRLLASGRPELPDVARALASSGRTLQRRLAELGVTYQQVVEDARRDLARHYLQHSTLELAEVSYLLGYDDANSFFRAFARWEGIPPGRWRERSRRAEIEEPEFATAQAS